ncbi:MAG TPA: competence/damage-inducible protein A [Solirubrobacteraceae bacterium]|nr:competence/damage-inducible protein A [Solirubrobacteraceae bacterium]
MSARAGIVVTGTEVLTGRVSDRNGPWLAERLRELGVDLAFTSIVGDRPEDMQAALRFMSEEGMDIVLTSGGLGPTADDLTAEVVGRFQGREMVLDPELEAVIAKIIEPLAKRWPNLDREAIRASNRKQATIPAGATVLPPVGTAPGLVVPPAANGGPTVIVLPGPPRELQPMWTAAVDTEALRGALKDATTYRQRMLRMFGIPESEIALTLREAEGEGVDLSRLEITTCLKRGEVEVVTRYEPHLQEVYDAFERIVRERHADTLFSDDGSTVDEQVAGMLRTAGLTVAVAESCTGGLLAGRLTDLPGSSDYMRGAIVAYSDDVKVAEADVPRELIDRHGAVSLEVCEALADGARSRLGADIGVGVTGVAGPGGGSEEKPVGLVWLSVAAPGEIRLTRSVNLPGGRVDVRERATTVGLHLLRRVLLDLPGPRGTP